MNWTYRFAAPVLAMAVATLGTGTVSAALAPSGGHGYWSMYMDGPAHNGDNRAETTLSTSTVSGLVVTHTYTHWLGFGGGNGVYPVVMGSLASGLVAASGNRIHLDVFNIPSGSVRWSDLVFRGDPLPASPVPALSNGNVFVGIGNVMDAYNASTGHLLWRETETSGATFNETTVANGVVYAATYDIPSVVYAFKATTGALVWSAPLGTTECCSLGAVSVTNGVAYATAAHLWAFNATTGAHLFTSNVTTGAGMPVVSGGEVYIETTDSVAAYSASTGGQLWSSTTAPGDVYSSLDVAIDGSTVVAATPQYVIAFNATSGARLWTYDSSNSSTDYLPPAIANGVVYAGSIGDGLQAFSEASGEVLYSHSMLSFGSPIVSNSAVYLVDGSGQMRVFGL
jgi:outer membrane protein assembly factor BamB